MARTLAARSAAAKPSGAGGEGRGGRHDGTLAGLVHVDPPDTGGANGGCLGEVIEGGVVYECGVDAVADGHEPLEHASEDTRDLPASVVLLGELVVHDLGVSTFFAIAAAILAAAVLAGLIQSTWRAFGTDNPTPPRPSRSSPPGSRRT